MKSAGTSQQSKPDVTADASEICSSFGAPTAVTAKSKSVFHDGERDSHGGCYAPEGPPSLHSLQDVSQTQLILLQITESLSPTRLEIHNDSHLHSHHKAMAGSSATETHFRVVITSAAFEKKMQPARHRMVYALLKEEMAREGGIHALQLRTRTLEEERRQEAREIEEAKGSRAVEGAGVAVEE
ncbi:hypothetical protein D0Z07_8495 [Hyphodiscus hymeniophilus]|uniref:BolA-like protein n=1 Tax=Hyphodiscus hymeniophilus TaxID=353542 RepID=A0A9P6SKJ4_9HELO|nr:hypothetical protein D0Z07_8495 [Hyphodiscus hymeniophilus]